MILHSVMVSPSQSLTFTNLRNDIAQTVTVTAKDFPDGVNLSDSGNIVLEPHASNTKQLSLTVDNTKIANGIYTGSLVITIQNQT